MNLYELQKEIDWKRIVLRNAIKSLLEIERKMKSPKTSNINEVVVQGGKRVNNIDRLLERKQYLEERVETITEELKDYKKMWKELKQDKLVKNYLLEYIQELEQKYGIGD